MTSCRSSMTATHLGCDSPSMSGVRREAGHYPAFVKSMALIRRTTQSVTLSRINSQSGLRPTVTTRLPLWMDPDMRRSY